MYLTKRIGLVVGAAALTVTGGSFADTTEGVSDSARIAELEAKVARLTASQSDSWLTEQRADEIRGLVQDVLADADTRACSRKVLQLVTMMVHILPVQMVTGLCTLTFTCNRGLSTTTGIIL